MQQPVLRRFVFPLVELQQSFSQAWKQAELLLTLTASHMAAGLLLETGM